MKDYCFFSDTELSILTVLNSIGLANLDDTGKIAPIGDYLYIGNGYSIYRANYAQMLLIESTVFPSNVSIVDPPNNIPLFGGEWIIFDLDSFKTETCNKIDRTAESLRNSVSTFGSGQMALYQLKTEQAELCLKDSSPSEEKYPDLYNEIGITADNIQNVAMIIMAKSEKYSIFSRNIEKVRLQSKKSIREATNIISINQIVDTIVWPTY